MIQTFKFNLDYWKTYYGHMNTENLFTRALDAHSQYSVIYSNEDHLVWENQEAMFFCPAEVRGFIHEIIVTEQQSTEDGH